MKNRWYNHLANVAAGYPIIATHWLATVGVPRAARWLWNVGIPAVLLLLAVTVAMAFYLAHHGYLWAVKHLPPLFARGGRATGRLAVAIWDRMSPPLRQWAVGSAAVVGLVSFVLTMLAVVGHMH